MASVLLKLKERTRLEDEPLEDFLKHDLFTNPDLKFDKASGQKQLTIKFETKPPPPPDKRVFNSKETKKPSKSTKKRTQPVLRTIMGDHDLYDRAAKRIRIDAFNHKRRMKKARNN